MLATFCTQNHRTVNLLKTEWLLGGYKQSGVTAQLDTHEDLVLNYQGTPLKRVKQFKYLGLMYMGYPGMALMINTQMVKSKQVWKVLGGYRAS